MKIEILKPFGPSIVKLKIPEEVIYEMNKFTDNIIKDEKKLKTYDHGQKLVGNVQQEILLDIEFMKRVKWAEFLGAACQEWVIKEKDIHLKKFEIIKSWIVRQFKNEYNPIHYHTGHVSGVGYLKIPKNLGQTVQKNKPINHNGKLVLIDGSKKLFCKPSYIITPEVGDFYLFPNYMMHTVYPFTDSDEERRSVSFNAVFDNEAASI
jgi:hypothetical protein